MGRGEMVTQQAEEISQGSDPHFCEGDSLPQLQQRFFAYSQGDEDFLSCSLTLVELYDRIVQLDSLSKRAGTLLSKGVWQRQ